MKDLKKSKNETEKASLDSDYNIDEFKLDEQLVDTDQTNKTQKILFKKKFKEK